MTNFTDIIKERFLQEFTEITLESMLTALVLSCILSCIVVLVYRITYSGVLYSHSFAISLVLLSMVTSLVILTVSSNVVLSLGMVGALSIVRFRTAVKDPLDTVYMFWAIGIGITTGAGLIPISIIATLVIGALFMLVKLISSAAQAAPYMIIIRYDEKAERDVERLLKKFPRSRVKSRSSSSSGEEVVLEVRLTKALQNTFKTLKNAEGVHEVNMVAYSGTTLL